MASAAPDHLGLDPHTSLVPAMTAPRWVVLNLKLGAFSFGAGSIAPSYRRALVVEARTLSAEQFQDALTVAQLLPGPNLVSLAMALGTRLFGYGPAVAGVVALCLPGAVWALVTVALIPMELPLVRAIVAGFAIAAAGLLLDLALQLHAGLRVTHTAGQRAPLRRRCARVVVVVAVAALSFCGFPLLTAVLAGIAGGAAAELLA
jgi:chromate transporter